MIYFLFLSLFLLHLLTLALFLVTADRGYFAESPVFARLSRAHWETTAKSHQKDRRVLHVEIELPGKKMLLLLSFVPLSHSCFFF
jgi:hypothetical protein